MFWGSRPQNPEGCIWRMWVINPPSMRSLDAAKNSTKEEVCTHGTVQF